jgi:PAS domain S-box-containing protein
VNVKRRKNAPPAPIDLFAGGGEAGELMRQKDWSLTPLGPVEHWPQSLRTIVPVMLASRFAMRVMWGREFIFLYNDNYRPILGAEKHPSAMGRPAHESFTELWPIVGPMFERVYTGEAVAIEDGLLPLNRNGYLEECYFTLSYSPIRDDSGAVGGLLGVVYETTVRVLAERRLRTLRALAASASRGKTVDQACALTAAALTENPADVPFALIYLCDPDHGHARLAACRGLDGREDVAPQRIALDAAAPWPLARDRASVVVPDLAERFTPIHAGPHAVSQAIVLRLTRPGLETPYGFLIAGTNPRRALDDDYRAFFALASEHVVTALENALAHSQAEQARDRLYRQFMQAPVAVSVVVGPSFVFDMANPLYEDMVKRKHLVGQSMREAFPEIEDHAPVLEMLRQVARSGETFHAEEFAVPLDRKGDGTTENAYFKLTCQPMRDGGDNISGIMTVAVDVTAEVATRQERQALLAREREVLAEAELANRAKDEFLAMLGHELRNPLAPILTALQLMRLRGDDTLERERAIIERQVGHVIRLVDDLLDVSRITRGRVELKRERIELAEVVAKAVEIASPLIEQRQHRLSIAVPRTGLMLHADPVRLAQVISNLLTNAAKYTEPRGEISAAAAATPSGIELRVRDNGIGLGADMKTRIFEPFVQQQQASDRAQGGLGLGLAIVRNFVEMHGGSVEAKSDGPGRGSEFLLRLPFAECGHMAERRTGPRIPQGPATSGSRVLVVDDNVDAAELLCESLRTMGYVTDIAHDGPSALRLAASAQLQVALLDIGLPVMDGYELAHNLRKLPGMSELPLVAVTGYGQQSDRDQSRSAGFDAHLVKPIQLGELRRVIERLLPREELH